MGKRKRFHHTQQMTIRKEWSNNNNNIMTRLSLYSSWYIQIETNFYELSVVAGIHSLAMFGTRRKSALYGTQQQTSHDGKNEPVFKI